MSKIEEIMKEVGCETKEELIAMMNDPNNKHPLIIDLRELFIALDSSEGGEYKIE